MTLSRTFSQDPKKQLQKAFKSGEYSQVIRNFKTMPMQDLMGALSDKDSYVTLSPDLLSLSEDNMVAFFKSLPEHIRSLNFHFSHINPADLQRFQSLMAASQYAEHANIFNIVWDFVRFPMVHLVNMSFKLPSQLALVNFAHNCMGAGLVNDADWYRFEVSKLSEDTKLEIDVHYSYVLDHGRNTAYDFAQKLR